MDKARWGRVQNTHATRPFPRLSNTADTTHSLVRRVELSPSAHKRQQMTVCELNQSINGLTYSSSVCRRQVFKRRRTETDSTRVRLLVHLRHRSSRHSMHTTSHTHGGSHVPKQQPQQEYSYQISSHVKHHTHKHAKINPNNSTAEIKTRKI